MKNRFFLFSFFLLGLSPIDLTAQRIDLCAIENSSFKDQERLVYRVFYNWGFVWVPAGEVLFEVVEKKETYEVTVIGQTFASYNSFFEVNDYFYSKMDRDSLYPIQFTRNIQEGNYTRYDSINFRHKSGRAVGKLGKTRAEARAYDLPIDACTHDIISALYHIRNVDLNDFSKGQITPVSVFFDKESFYPNLEYGGIEAKKIKNIGKVKAHKLVPELVAGEVFNEDSRMKIWVSDDANQLPLLIESPVSIGSVKAILWKSEGLRYPADFQSTR